MKFRKKPVVIDATQWWQNGDHPLDHLPLGHGDPAKYADYVFDTEGKIVRRYNTPNMDGKMLCKHCGNSMRQHGWIDTLEGGHIVCPGDWVITGVQGEHYPCKPDIFAATYEPADDHGTTGIVAPAPNRELSFGEKAVGLSFNPSGDPAVHRCKVEFAAVIDHMHELRMANMGSSDIHRMASIAITEAQTAQMWAVKAITWRD